MKGKITKSAVDALIQSAKAASGTVFLWDMELVGFGAKATASGKCVFILQYRLGGRGTPTKRLTLGSYGDLTPDEARKRAKKELGALANGSDPAQAKKDKLRKLTGATFAQVAERFIKDNAEPNRYWAQKAARLKGSDVKALANQPMTLIERSDVIAVLNTVQDRSVSSARVLFADIRPIFAWALDQGIIEANPILGMRGPKNLRRPR